MSIRMKAVKTQSGLTTGVTSGQVNQFLEKCGADYVHYDNEQYPSRSWMRERIIAIHKNAKVFYSENIELGRCFAFSQEEANEYFSKAELELNA